MVWSSVCAKVGQNLRRAKLSPLSKMPPEDLVGGFWTRWSRSNHRRAGRLRFLRWLGRERVGRTGSSGRSATTTRTYVPSCPVPVGQSLSHWSPWTREECRRTRITHSKAQAVISVILLEQQHEIYLIMDPDSRRRSHSVINRRLVVSLQFADRLTPFSNLRPNRKLNCMTIEVTGTNTSGPHTANDAITPNCICQSHVVCTDPSHLVVCCPDLPDQIECGFQALSDWLIQSHS